MFLLINTISHFKIGSMQGDEQYIYSPIGETTDIEKDVTWNADAMHGPARRGNVAAAAFGCGVENLSL